MNSQKREFFSRLWGSILLVAVIVSVTGLSLFTGTKSEKNTERVESIKVSDNVMHKDSNVKFVVSSQLYPVELKGGKFNPASLTVPLEARVTWVNRDKRPHAIIGSFADKPQALAPNQSYSCIFTKVGAYHYHCTIHPSEEGTIIVQ